MILPIPPSGRTPASTKIRIILITGNFQAKTTHMSKRGSRVLRYALVNAAWNVVRNNATFKAYYNAKRAEGRSHYNALDMKKKFFANLWLTFHSWSAFIPLFLLILKQQVNPQHKILLHLIILQLLQLS